ncbi:MAG: hypothetical protein JW772_02100 [Candidatus Diapherotrites archaeon]|nr:hypothetical protein [Candidatus Diapherotrites archaeon]
MKLEFNSNVFLHEAGFGLALAGVVFIAYVLFASVIPSSEPLPFTDGTTVLAAIIIAVIGVLLLTFNKYRKKVSVVEKKKPVLEKAKNSGLGETKKTGFGKAKKK